MPTHNPFMLLVLLAAVLCMYCFRMAQQINKQRGKVPGAAPRPFVSFVGILFLVSGVGCALAVAHDLGLLS